MPSSSFQLVLGRSSSSDVPDDTVYAVVKSIFEHFDEFRKLHPALAHLEPEQMVRQGLTMPLPAVIDLTGDGGLTVGHLDLRGEGALRQLQQRRQHLAGLLGGVCTDAIH